MRPLLKLAALAVSLSLWWAAPATATTLDPVGEFDQPIFVTSDPGDENELLVVEREGRVVLVDGAGIHLFGNLEALVSCCEGERGLLSIAVAPDFPTTGRFYAAYTGTPAAGGAEGDLHVDSLRPAPAGGGELLRDPIVSVGHSSLSNHNGGQLQLGPDGYLYISTGDGGGGGDPLGSGQSLDTLLGKILRIEPRPGAEPPYASPPGNPFVGQPGLDEIWSYGLRNPWRFSFDRTSGDMVVGDVGQGAREEVDLALSPAPGAVGGASANYGWNCREGFIAYSGAPASCTGAGGFTDPVFDYPHSDPGGGNAFGCSITGGYVVRDPSLGDLYGRYLYADFCAGEVRSLALPAVAGGRASGDRSEGLNVSNPVSFGEDSCGRLYVVAIGGTVYRLTGALPAPCSGTPSSPATPPPGPLSGGSEGEAPAPRRESALVRLRAAGTGPRLVLTARVLPCAEPAEGEVQLNRGGRRIAVKRLDSNCSARFRPRVAQRSTFRALLSVDGATAPSRSPRLVLFAAGPRG